ncbi:MAG: ATP-binding protein, partial [Anaerolineales bacterium]|nr:ATP-binding protein [Anaerolineales bacterium]
NTVAMAGSLTEASGLYVLGHMTFDNFMPQGLGLSPERQKNLQRAYDLAFRFAENPEGWILLKGGFGAGKTHLAAAIANYRLQLGQPALFIVVPDLLDYLRATYSPNSAVTYDERFEALRGAPLLLLDDFGAHSATPWAQEKLFQLLNYRYNAQLPTVITTNQELEEIDLRLRSRLADVTLCQIVHINAPDFRQSGANRVESELSTLHLHRDQRFDNFDLREREMERGARDALRAAYDTCKHYAEAPEGWLVLTGEYGSGKTHLAAAIANWREQAGDTPLFIVVPDLLDHLRATYNPHSPITYDRRFDEIRNASFLVLDDLGTESATPWAKEKLFQIVNYRYAARLPTVFTTSQTVDEIEPRLRSRMVDLRRCTIIADFAPSYRGDAKSSGSARRGKSKK